MIYLIPLTFVILYTYARLWFWHQEAKRARDHAQLLHRLGID